MGGRNFQSRLGACSGQVYQLDQSRAGDGIVKSDEWSPSQVLWHPVLGARLKECVELVLAVKGKTAFQIFGTPDDLKLRSSITLFCRAVPGELLFKGVLAKYFDGREDPRTVELLARL